MINKEAIEKLEKAKKKCWTTDTKTGIQITGCKDMYDLLDQALAKLKEQPPASEFTKECREVVIEGQCGKDIKEAVEPEVMVEVDNDGNITPVKQVQKPKRGKQSVTGEGKQETEKCHPDECICDECKTRQVNDQRFKNKLEYYETKGVICSGPVVTVKPKRGKDINRFTDLSSASEFTKENRDFINDANRDFQANRVEGNCVIDYVRALRELGKACDIIEQLQAQHEEDENIYKQVAGHNDILIAENKKLLEGQAKVNK